MSHPAPPCVEISSAGARFPPGCALAPLLLCPTPMMPARRVFVADDDPVLLRGLELGLTARGYTVRTAANGRRLLALLESEVPDMVVVDVAMPGLSGLDVLQTIRASTRWAALPVVMITALADASVAAAARAHGAAGVVPKPFRLAELVNRIECAVGERSAAVLRAPA
jgi:two-component system, OmpR family, KDP operon response regulator KdpE